MYSYADRAWRSIRPGLVRGAKLLGWQPRHGRGGMTSLAEIDHLRSRNDLVAMAMAPCRSFDEDWSCKQAVLCRRQSIEHIVSEALLQLGYGLVGSGNPRR